MVIFIFIDVTNTQMGLMCGVRSCIHLAGCDDWLLCLMNIDDCKHTRNVYFIFFHILFISAGPSY